MTLLFILLAAAAATFISIGLAAIISLGRLSRLVDQLVSFSVGMLLGSAFLHLLPESLHMGADFHDITATVLVGLLSFFALERLSFFRHDHHHELDGHDHPHGHDAAVAGKGGSSLLVGSTIHAFADGILIAAAFNVDWTLGLITALAIATHEVPQQIGNFFVLLNSGFSKPRALIFNLLTGSGALVGGVLGYFALGQVGGLLPFVLAIAASNFMYIALSDLIPQLHAQADGSGSHGHVHSHAVPRSQPQVASANHHHSHDHASHGGPHKAHEAHEDHEGQASEQNQLHNAQPHTAKVSATWLQPLLMLAGVGLAYLATSLLHSH
ncbi:MAG: ZIP family metal transporter [Burkholderiaceae bacterium]|nr:ZIP family metal transporter [Burkholderiaceae bacterium]